MSGYLVKDTTKEERIALIRSWQEPDDCVGGSGMDLFDMYDAYIRGEKEIAEINGEFQASYVKDTEDLEQPEEAKSTNTEQTQLTTLTVQVNIHDTTLVEKSGQAVSAFLRGDIHYGEYHRRKHTKISGTDRTAAFTDRLRGDCTGAETAIGKYAFRTVSGQPSDGAQGIGDFAE